MIRAYGDHPEQILELLSPADAPIATVALIHGGCWRAERDRTLQEAVARDLVARGYAAANVEYRRLDAGGTWPEPLLDVVAAIATLAEAPILVGHSAGGYLALVAAAATPVRAVVAQAPVVDLRLALAAGTCAGAVGRLLAAGAPSPVDVAIAVPHVLIHGDADPDVPIASSRAYTAGERIELAGCGHMEHLDPTSEAWQTAVAWIATH